MLDEAQQHADEGISQLKLDKRFTFGDCIENTFQPAVLDATTAKEAREATEYVRSIQGIVEVHVVSVDFQNDQLLENSGVNGSTIND